MTEAEQSTDRDWSDAKKWRMDLLKSVVTAIVTFLFAVLLSLIHISEPTRPF